jgi:hypothetical protein
MTIQMPKRQQEVPHKVGLLALEASKPLLTAVLLCSPLYQPAKSAGHYQHSCEQNGWTAEEQREHDDMREMWKRSTYASHGY